MPDHAHLLMSVTTGNLIATIGGLKSQSTRIWHGFGGQGPLWQRSFHDQGLRTETAVTEAVRYVLNNPIMAGLVERWEEYDLVAGTLVGR
jgi:REP element-mobilizing transposase RayT